MKEKSSSAYKKQISNGEEFHASPENLDSIKKNEKNKIKKYQDKLIDKLKNPKTNNKKKEIIWDLLSNTDTIEEAVNLAKNKLKEINPLEKYPIITNELRHAIAYLLERSNQPEKLKIIDILLSKASNEIKLMAAEYFLRKNENNKAMEIFLEILEDEKIDHNVSDAIDMHIASFANNEILSFINEKIEKMKSDDENYKSKILMYVASILKISIQKGIQA